MPDWRSDYLTSLQEAERNNPVNKDLVTACSSSDTPPLLAARRSY